MDVFSMNYRQLQSEAKKRGIKANQKIDILRLKVNEALNRSSNNVESNSFIATSTPSIQNSRSSFLSNLNMSSSEDIDKILGTNRRNSQFFDDILNFPNKENTIAHSNSDNIKDISESSSFHENAEENIISKGKRELNVTFEMDEFDKQESQITEEQRKLASAERITNNSCKHVDPPVVKSTSNNRENQKYDLTVANRKINNHNNNNNINKNNTKFLDKTNFCKPKQFKPINKCIALAEQSKLIKPSGNVRKSNIVDASKKFGVNPVPIYQKKIVRPSMLPINNNNKSSRTTMCGALSKKII